MQVAMKFGAPPAAQVVFKIRVLPVSNVVEDKVAAGNSVDESKKSKGPYRRYAVDYLADASAIQFERPADGGYRDNLEYVLCVYAMNGELINVVSSNVGVNFTKAQYAALMQRGLPFQQVISVPAKGEYFLRVGLHDLNADHIGSVEVPIDAVKDLTPIASAAGPEAPKR